MNELIKRYAERIDAAGQRERVLIFLALTLVLTLLANAFFLEPLRTKQSRLAAEIAQQQKEMRALQTELQRLAQDAAGDPDAPNRNRLSALREELRQLNARIVEEQRRFTPPERMRRVLEEILEKNRGLTLVDLKTLPVAPLLAQRPSGGTAGMYRHGIDLTVRGTYVELHNYLQELEKLPNQLYWARAELSVATHPLLTLKLTVHTLSFDRAWLIV
jgi:MSHA biogenesis protein MshJ